MDSINNSHERRNLHLHLDGIGLELVSFDNFVFYNLKESSKNGEGKFVFIQTPFPSPVPQLTLPEIFAGNYAAGVFKWQSKKEEQEEEGGIRAHNADKIYCHATRLRDSGPRNTSNAPLTRLLEKKEKGS